MTTSTRTARLRPSAARLVLLLALAAGLSLPVAPATADCESSLLGCDLQALEDAERVSLRQVSATLTVPASSLGRYAALLPPGYRVPAEPRIGVVVRELTPAGPLLGARRVEAVVALRTVAQGEDGWFPLVWLTDARDAYAAGREAGLPTVLGQGSVDEALVGSAEVAGAPALTLRPEVGSSPIDGVDAAWARLTEPSFSQRPVFDGPARWRSKQTALPLLPVPAVVPAVPLVPPPPSAEGVTATAPARRATVEVSIDPDLGRLDAGSPAPLPDVSAEPWLEGLVDGPSTVPGIVWEAEVTLLTERGNAHTGSGGLGIPGIGAGAGFVVAPPLAQTVGFATPVAVMTQGGSLTFVNVDNAAHDVVSEGLAPDGSRLFRSDYANVGQAVPVEGVEDLAAGDYGFFCSIHPSMRGTLTVL
jgi:plastocyanin